MSGVDLIGFALAAGRTRAFDNERRTLKTRNSESCIIAGQYAYSATRTTYPWSLSPSLELFRCLQKCTREARRGRDRTVSSFSPAAPISSLSEARGSGSDLQWC
jgi:hypothetical protein